MPEGPEIWRSADRLSRALKNHKTQKVFFAFDELKPYEDELTGTRIIDVEPRGKALLTRFENHLNIYSHNQLYGKWYVRERGDIPDTNRKLRVAIHNDLYSAYLYSASDIEVLKDDELDEHDFLKKLGPDVLDDRVTLDQVECRFRNRDFQNRKLTTLLLDQEFLSGLGNYLRSEILFKAGIHPSMRPADCDDDQIRALAKASIKMARRSYETGGITNELEIVEALKEEGAERSDYRFFVFNREDERCFKCGTPINKIKSGGRRLYYCPECQPEPEE